MKFRSIFRSISSDTFLKAGLGVTDGFNNFTLRVCYWNINGQTEIIESDVIKNWLLSNVDIYFVLETHLKPEQKCEISPFITVNNAYTGHSKKTRGGVSCIVRASCKQFVSKIDKLQDDVITVTLVGGTG